MTKTKRTKEAKKQWVINKKQALADVLDTFLTQALTDPGKMQILTDHFRIANLYEYSMLNSAMIQAQGGTIAQSFKKWEDLGRYVKRGETARIHVYVPFQRSKEAADKLKKTLETTQDPAARLEIRRKIEQAGRIFFTLGPVFDISQTDGEPLKYDHNSEDLLKITYADVKTALSPLVKQAITEGPDAGGARGWCSDTQIFVSTLGNNTDMVKTLVHEVAHAIMHRNGEDNSTSRGGREVEAESVAHLVLTYLGHEPELSAAYVGNWAKQGQDYDKVQIVKAAEQIIKALV